MQPFKKSMARISVWFWLLAALLPEGVSFAQSPVTVSGSVIYNQLIGQGVDKQGVLVFSSDESLYYFQRNNRRKASLNEVVIEERGNAAEYTYDVADREGFSYYLNRSTGQLLSRTFNFFATDYVIVKEPLPAINWVIGQETRVIGKHQAQKATGTFRGRTWEAWFTPDIPVGLGPWKLHGLPGLILEARDTEGRFSYEVTAIQMPSEVKTPLVPPRTGSLIEGWEAYRQHIHKAADRWTRSVTSRGPGMEAQPYLNEGLEKID